MRNFGTLCCCFILTASFLFCEEAMQELNVACNDFNKSVAAACVSHDNKDSQSLEQACSFTVEKLQQVLRCSSHLSASTSQQDPNAMDHDHSTTKANALKVCTRAAVIILSCEACCPAPGTKFQAPCGMSLRGARSMHQPSGALAPCHDEVDCTFSACCLCLCMHRRFWTAS